VAYDTQNEEKIFKTFNRMSNEPRAKKDPVPAARFVLFGFQQMYEQMSNPESRLYNFMVFLPLKSLDKESALGLVTRPMNDIHIKWKNEHDAEILVESFSRYPFLLQAACHTLLTILDSKKGKRDMIEGEDIEKVLCHEKFLKLCMRFYDPIIKKSLKLKKGLFSKRKQSVEWDHEPFFEDIHKITILIAVKLHYEDGKKSFTLTDLQKELKKYKIELSPSLVREIINRLCLNGTLSLIEEPSLITPKDKEVMSEFQQEEIKNEVKNIRVVEDFKVDKPDIYSAPTETFPKFKYEFGVKIFPQLLIANLDGIEKCKEELRTLLVKKSWEYWIKRKLEDE